MWMLGCCLEIVEYSFKEVYYDMFIPGIIPMLPIILTVVVYPIQHVCYMCACRNPVYCCLSGTTCVRIIVQ